MQSRDAQGDSTRSKTLVIGDWTVLPSQNALVRGGEQVRLEPRVMDVLVCLAEHADRPVPKEELTARIWKSEYISDDVLAVTIYSLRKALGDEARRPRYIQTVSRRGYQLIAPAQFVESESVQTRRDTPTPTVARHRRRYAWPTAAAAVALVVLALGAVQMLTGARHSRHVAPAEAYEAYRKGRFFLDQRSIRGWREALQQFERAVALDPNDPAAHAGLADTYSAMSDFGIASPAEMRPRAMQAARRALELDPQSPEALEALGRAQFLFDWDFDAAEHSLERALERDRDYMPAHQAMAWLKSARGQYDEAIAAARRALQLDPVNTARYTELAWVLGLGGRHGDALREVERALQLSPRSFESYFMKGWVHEVSRQPDLAFAAYRDALRILGMSEEMLQKSDAVYRAQGLAGFYRSWLTGGGNAPMSDTWRAQVYVRLGDRDRAIEHLEQAYTKREGALAWINVEPSFEPLRSDARFQRIAARVGRRN